MNTSYTHHGRCEHARGPKKSCKCPCKGKLHKQITQKTKKFRKSPNTNQVFRDFIINTIANEFSRQLSV